MTYKAPLPEEWLEAIRSIAVRDPLVVAEIEVPPRAAKDLEVGDTVTVAYDPMVYMHVTAPPSVASILSFDEDDWVSLVGINGDGRRERFRTKRHKLTRAD